MLCPAIRGLSLLLLVVLAAPAWAESTSEFYTSRSASAPAAQGLRFGERGEVDTRGAFPTAASSAPTSANSATPTTQPAPPAPAPPAAAEDSGIWTLVAAVTALALCLGMFSVTRLLRGRSVH